MASEATSANIAITHFDSIDPALFEPAVVGLQQSGVSVRVVAESSPGRGDMGPLALLMTGVVVSVTEILFHKVIEEAGKDLYTALKRAFTLIWARLHPVNDPGYSSQFSMKLSLTVEQSGTILKLLLAPQTTPAEAELAFIKFIQFATRRQERPAPPEIFVFDSATRRLSVIDPDSDD